MQIEHVYLKVFKQLMFTTNTYIVTDWKTQEESKENMVLKCHAAPKAEEERPLVCKFNEGKKNCISYRQFLSHMHSTIMGVHDILKPILSMHVPTSTCTAGADTARLH